MELHHIVAAGFIALMIYVSGCLAAAFRFTPSGWCGRIVGVVLWPLVLVLFYLPPLLQFLAQTVRRFCDWTGCEVIWEDDWVDPQDDWKY